MRGLVTAIRTLTIVPMPGKDAADLAAALVWFPIVGGLLGLSLYASAIAAQAALGTAWPEGVALAVVLLGSLLTRGLHLDGLADWADGFAAAADREQTLRIMKDPRLGAFGVLALLAVLAAKWLAVARLVQSGTLVWLVAAYTVSRTIQVELAASLPYARTEAGTAAPFVNGARPWHRAMAWLICCAALAAIGPGGLLAALVGLLAVALLRRWFKRRVSGVTGDLLGAASELVETLVLVLAALPGARSSALFGWSILAEFK